MIEAIENKKIKNEENLYSSAEPKSFLKKFKIIVFKLMTNPVLVKFYLKATFSAFSNKSFAP